MQNFSQTQLDRLADIVRKTRPLFENTELLSSVHQKGQADFVTDVDYQVQSFLLSELAAFRPDIQFMGEEKDNSNIDFSGLVWILDPVDGTTNLIHRFRQSSRFPGAGRKSHDNRRHHLQSLHRRIILRPEGLRLIPEWTACHRQLLRLIIR